MQNEDDSISGVKPQSIIKALQPSLLQLGVIGQMRFTVKHISLGDWGTVFHRDFQADLLASRKMDFSAENSTRGGIINSSAETSFSLTGKTTFLPIMWIS